MGGLKTMLQNQALSDKTDDSTSLLSVIGAININYGYSLVNLLKQMGYGSGEEHTTAITETSVEQIVFARKSLGASLIIPRANKNHRKRALSTLIYTLALVGVILPRIGINSISSDNLDNETHSILRRVGVLSKELKELTSLDNSINDLFLKCYKLLKKYFGEDIIDEQEFLAKYSQFKKLLTPPLTLKETEALARTYQGVRNYTILNSRKIAEQLSQVVITEDRFSTPINDINIYDESYIKDALEFDIFTSGLLDKGDNSES